MVSLPPEFDGLGIVVYLIREDQWEAFCRTVRDIFVYWNLKLAKISDLELSQY